MIRVEKVFCVVCTMWSLSVNTFILSFCILVGSRGVNVIGGQMCSFWCLHWLAILLEPFHKWHIMMVWRLCGMVPEVWLTSAGAKMIIFGTQSHLPPTTLFDTRKSPKNQAAQDLILTLEKKIFWYLISYRNITEIFHKHICTIFSWKINCFIWFLEFFGKVIIFAHHAQSSKNSVQLL